MREKKIAVIGGDLRSVKLANILRSVGNKVTVFGFKNAGFDLGMEEAEDIKSAVESSEIIIGPIPCSNDSETINAPFHEEKIYINDVFKLLTHTQIFISGRIGEKIEHLAQVYGIYTIDLLEREEMAILNAIPTAEGAIQIAMEELPITVHGSKTMVLGYGRVGKMLSGMLHGIGSTVYVEARKYSDIAWISSYGYIPVRLGSLGEFVENMDIIFNTIPHTILDFSLLSKLKKECLVIDLASKPGGVDFDSAKRLGIKVIWALSLPGKVAPVTAATIIKETIYNILDELGG